MKYRDKIIAYLDTIEPGTVLNLNGLYEKQFYKMSQAAFFKAGSPKEAQEAVLNYYFGENNDNGMYIGYHLYHKYGITEEKSDVVELYSNKMTKQTANIGNIHVKRTTIVLNYENTRVVEALEILEHFDEIEGLNKHKFARYARQFATGYQDAAAVYVIENMKYKKRTVAFMKKILDMYKMENSLGQFISFATRYRQYSGLQRYSRHDGSFAVVFCKKMNLGLYNSKICVYNTCYCESNKNKT